MRMFDHLDVRSSYVRRTVSLAFTEQCLHSIFAEFILDYIHECLTKLSLKALSFVENEAAVTVDASTQTSDGEKPEVESAPSKSLDEISRDWSEGVWGSFQPSLRISSWRCFRKTTRGL